jgi:hypothetical protein
MARCNCLEILAPRLQRMTLHEEEVAGELVQQVSGGLRRDALNGQTIKVGFLIFDTRLKHRNGLVGSVDAMAI